MTTIDQATVLKLTWKNATTISFAVEVVRVALRGTEFNNDDIPERLQPRDKTTVGAVFNLLRFLGVIEATDRVRPSTRPCCHGHRNLLWRLASHGMATAFLRVNEAATTIGQQEFQLQMEAA